MPLVPAQRPVELRLYTGRLAALLSSGSGWATYPECRPAAELPTRLRF